MIPAVGPILVLLGLAVALPWGGRKAGRRAWTGPFMGLVALFLVSRLEPGDVLCARFWEQDLVLVEVTNLRLVFAWAFAIALTIWGVYAWRLKDLVERGAGLVYAGCAFGVVFAGDLLTLFLFWEGMAIASTVVVLCGRTEASSRAAFRYVMVHLFGGVILLVGIALHHADTGSLAFGPIALEGAGAWLVLVGFLVNAAAWPLSAWLPDAYPTASPTGTVLLGTFTTKTAVYVLVAAFAGADILLLLGAAMAIYAVIYALGTRDYRRLLAYSLVGQVGYMLCAAGAGGELGASGAAAHAFMHVLYKSLLFMAAGAVLLRTGRAVGGGFGGLRRCMPYTFAFAIVGAATICAVPFTSAFVSKSLIFEALHESHAPFAHVAETTLLITSAAAPLYVGLRFLWLAFSGRDEGVRVARAPLSMRIAMGATALLCVGFGVYAEPLLALLPGAQGVAVFTWSHIAKQLLLLAIGTVAFFALRAVRRRRRLPHADPLPDTDVVYLGLVRGFVSLVKGPLMALFVRLSRWAHVDVPRGLAFFARNPAGCTRLGYERVRMGWAGFVGFREAIDEAQARFERQAVLYRSTPAAATWPIGRTVLFGALLLATCVLVLMLS